VRFTRLTNSRLACTGFPSVRILTATPPRCSCTFSVVRSGYLVIRELAVEENFDYFQIPATDATKRDTANEINGINIVVGMVFTWQSDSSNTRAGYVICVRRVCVCVCVCVSCA
jgi:hypothetical protein